MTTRDNLRGLVERFSGVLVLLVLAFTLYGAVDAGLRYWQISADDRSGAGTKFSMMNTGTTAPATCELGQMFFDTDATAGLNWYGCTSTDTWTLMGDGVGVSEGLPTGTIAYFASTCPAGWSEYTAARGRYIVGVPSGGTVAGTSGTALTDLQSRTVGAHTHTATNAAHTHTVTDPGHKHGISGTDPGTLAAAFGQAIAQYTINSGSTTTGITLGNATPAITVNSTGNSGTNAPYIQLRACQVI